MKRAVEIFADRADAGRRLAKALTQYKETDALALGIPRGGVEVGIEVADALDLDFSIIVARKLPFPGNPEFGFGAVAEDGSVYLLPEARVWLPKAKIDRIVEEQIVEVKRRIGALRGGRPLPEIRGRSAIIVDDGIAMGSTARAAVECCRHKGARRVIVAAPVASPDAVALLEKVSDEVVTLLSPPGFRAVADYYEVWRDATDGEVVALTERRKPRQGK